MELEKEIALLKEKVALLEKIKELQETIRANEKRPETVYVPYVVPYYPPLSIPADRLPWTKESWITWTTTPNTTAVVTSGYLTPVSGSEVYYLDDEKKSLTKM